MTRSWWMGLLPALALACAGDDDRAEALEIVTASLPDVEVNGGYDSKIEARGGVPPYTFTIASGELSDGLKLKAQTGQITGIAAEAGRATFTVAVSDFVPSKPG